MSKKFNITGTCIPERHYIVDISNKLEQVYHLIKDGEYFTINKPRQYGKTTFLFLSSRLLMSKKNYLAIRISFEGIDVETFNNIKSFIKSFLGMINDEINYLQIGEDYRDLVKKYIDTAENLNDLSQFITDLTGKQNKKFVLMIDEVDKSSNNQLFLDFIGMLRNKYLKRNEGRGSTFHSVILAGVHDIKNLKLKVRTDEEKKYNSPWNIAADFNIDLSFNPDEIATMLTDYSNNKNIEIDLQRVSEKLYYYTSGHPFLISKLCKIIDEEIMDDSSWKEEYIEKAVDQLLQEKNTNFESLIKNLENNKELYEIVKKIIFDGFEIEYSEDNTIIHDGVLYGIFKNTGKVQIHNRIYEQRIYNYMGLNFKIKELLNTRIENYTFKENYKNSDNSLNMIAVLNKFQEFMKHEYSKKDQEFLERNGRLIFLAFLKPIINGYGFDFKEVQVSEEKRLDIIITYLNKKYIIELKIWRGESYHKKGIKQLVDYLDRLDLDKGYMVIFNFIEKKRWDKDSVKIENKELFIVWV